jgi:hypothetical protein
MSNRIWLLVIVHFLAGIGFSAWAAIEGEIPFVLEYLLLLPPCAIILCQSCLLAFWAVMSRMLVWYRLAGFIAGTVYLEILFGAAIGDEDELMFLPSIATGIVTVALLATRLRKVQLLRPPDPSQPETAEGLRFSIRGLMLFTLVVAVLITALKALREVDDQPARPLLVAIWALCFVVTDLAALWSALGLAAPAARSTVVILMSPALGALFCYAVGAQWEGYFNIMTIMLLQSLCLIGSLLVVRSCGYRLTRRKNPSL